MYIGAFGGSSHTEPDGFMNRGEKRTILSKQKAQVHRFTGPQVHLDMPLLQLLDHCPWWLSGRSCGYLVVVCVWLLLTPRAPGP